MTRQILTLFTVEPEDIYVWSGLENKRNYLTAEALVRSEQDRIRSRVGNDTVRFYIRVCDIGTYSPAIVQFLNDHEHWEDYMLETRMDPDVGDPTWVSLGTKMWAVSFPRTSHVRVIRNGWGEFSHPTKTINDRVYQLIPTEGISCPVTDWETVPAPETIYVRKNEIRYVGEISHPQNAAGPVTITGSMIGPNCDSSSILYFGDAEIQSAGIREFKSNVEGDIITTGDGVVEGGAEWAALWAEVHGAEWIGSSPFSEGDGSARLQVRLRSDTETYCIREDFAIVLYARNVDARVVAESFKSEAIPEPDGSVWVSSTEETHVFTEWADFQEPVPIARVPVYDVCITVSA